MRKTADCHNLFHQSKDNEVVWVGGRSLIPAKDEADLSDVWNNAWCDWIAKPCGMKMIAMQRKVSDYFAEMESGMKQSSICSIIQPELSSIMVIICKYADTYTYPMLKHIRHRCSIPVQP